MKIKIHYYAFIFFLVFLSGCSNSTPSSIPTVDPKPVLSTPVDGKAGVSGRILSSISGKPYIEEYVFLAEVNYNDKGEGAYFLDSINSPTTKSDKNGYFQFKDISPHDYVLIVGDPMGQSMVLTDKSTGNPKVWKVETGKVLDLGDIKFELGN